MIIIQAVGCEPEDVSDVDIIRIMAKIFEHSTSGRMVTIGFGGSPAYLVSKTSFFKLKEVTPEQFKRDVPKAKDAQMLSIWDGEPA